jgi:Protein kinase domain
VNEPSPAPDTLDGLCLAEEVLHALAWGGLEAGQRSKALAHLDDCELCQALLADEVRALPRSPSAEDVGLPTLIQLEALVAERYRIKRFVARGGMGEVYAAWDTLLSERVALKTLNPVATSADQVKASARFRQEVQLSRRVADPHVCRMYEFGQHQVRGFGTLAYLTMEYIEGQTLGARLRQGPRLAIDEVVALSRQMLRGLGAAHSVGVLHRDFKSDNVMLRAKPESGGALHAVIMDFGLARLLGEQAHRLTERHELVGSAAYMAPEQLEEGAPLSEATDVYAFGVVLFEMLTGHLPFDGKSAVAVALRRLTHAAPPPSSHVGELSSEWDALVLGCLERDVARRFASTQQVAAALEAVSRGPVVAPANPRWRRGLATLAVASGAALIAAASYLASAQGRAGATPPAKPEEPRGTLALEPALPASAPVGAPIAAQPAAAQPAGTPAAAAQPAAAQPAGTPAAAAQETAALPAVVPPQPPRASGAARRAAPLPNRATPARSPGPSTPGVPASSAAPPAPADTPAPAAEDVRDLFFLEPPSPRRSQNSER